MKKAVLLLISIITSTFCSGQGIRFIEDFSWQQIMIKAKVEKKYILIDTYATWCVPCSTMNSEVFSDKLVGEFINDQFLSLKIQMNKTLTDKDSVKKMYSNVRMIDSMYRITAYPTILFFSPEGKLVSRSVGFRNVAGLIKEAKMALDSNLQYYSLLEKFHKGELDSTNMQRLVYQADALGDKVNSKIIAEKLMEGITENEVYSKSLISKIMLRGL